MVEKSGVQNRATLIVLSINVQLNCSQNFSIENITRCFIKGVWITWLSFKVYSRWCCFIVLQEKIVFWAWLEILNLESNFNWHIHLLVFVKSLLELLAKVCISNKEKFNVTSVKNLGLAEISIDKPFLWIKLQYSPPLI